MATQEYLDVAEVIRALQELGGEANWKEIEDRVALNRGGGYEPYLDWRNYKNTMFQLIQQHCEGYKKFRGTVYFTTVRTRRLSLVGHIAKLTTPQQDQDFRFVLENFDNSIILYR